MNRSPKHPIRQKPEQRRGYRLRLSTLYRYVLSYLLIFILPIGVLTFVLYRTAIYDVRQELLRSNRAKLDQLADYVEMRLAELRSLANHFQLDRTFFPAVMTENEIRMLDGMNKLSQYRSFSGILDDFQVFYRQTNDVFTANGRSSLANYADNRLAAHGKTDLARRYRSAIHDLRNPELLVLGDQEYNELIYLIPVFPSAGGVPQAVLVLPLDESRLNRQFRAQLGEQTSLYGLFRSDGIPLLIWPAAAARTEPDISALLSGEQTPSGLIRLTGVPTGDSAVRGIAWFDESNLFATTRIMGRIIVGVVCLLLLIGLWIISRLALRNVRPISDLASLVNEETAPADQAQRTLLGSDELERLRRGITSKLAENRHLQKRIEQQSPLARELLIERLITGVAIEEDEWQAFPLLRTEERLRAPILAVLIVEDRDPNCEPPEVLESLAEAIGRRAGWRLEFADRPDGHGRILLMIGFDVMMSDRRDIENVLMSIRGRLELDYRVHWQFALGLPGVGAGQVSRSFYEATAVIESDQLNERRPLLWFDELRTVSDRGEWFDPAEQMRLLQAIRHGDFRVARGSVSGILAEIAQSADAWTKRFQRYDLVNILTREAAQLPLPDEGQINGLRSIEFGPEWEDRLHQLLWQMCASSRQVQDQAPARIRQRIEAYLDTHAFDPALSLESCADAFNMTYYGFSRLFKDHFGYTFVADIAERRCNGAKRLLIETALPVAEIASRVGYLEQTSFIRMFKKTVGLTPGQYRDQSKT